MGYECCGVVLTILAIAKSSWSLSEFTVYEEPWQRCYEKWGGTCQRTDFAPGNCISFGPAVKISSIDPHCNCIKIYQDKKCQGSWLTLSPNSNPQCQLNLAQCHMTANLSWDNELSSISDCDFVQGVPPTKLKSQLKGVEYLDTPPGPYFVTLFQDPGFNRTGNWSDVDVGTGCVTIDENSWEREAQSILTYNKCILIYNSSECSDSSEMIRLTGSNPDLTLLTLERGIGSIKLCKIEPQEELPLYRVGTTTGSSSPMDLKPEALLSPAIIPIPTGLGCSVVGSSVGILVGNLVWALHNTLFHVW